jgi:FMN-dependent NADH-azoreductase
MLSNELIEALEAREGSVEVARRDLSEGIAHVDEPWIAANFTPEEERTRDQREALSASDALVEELQAADVIVIGSPIYNFGVPAALKAWIDMIARARKTFRYTSDGPEGLLKDKKVYLVIASGGVPVDSDVDFATPYLRYILNFVGLSDVDVIAADQLISRADESIDAARVRIAELVHTASQVDAA